MTTLVDDE